jgi:hypothetical protein
MADTNSIVPKYDKTSYNPGDKITLTFTGTVTRASDVQVTGVTMQCILVDNSAISISVPPYTVVGGQVQDMAPKITKVTDSANHTWVVASDGKSATTTA